MVVRRSLALADESVVRPRAIIPSICGELLRNLAVWNHPAQKFGKKIVEPKFYIRFSPQQDLFKLRKLVMWIEWFNTFQNKLLRIVTLLCFASFI